MKYALALMVSATALPSLALADDYIPPVIGGRTYVQHQVEAAKTRHSEITSIIVTGLRDKTKDNVILGSTAGAASVFRKVPLAEADEAAPSKDGHHFVVHEAFLSSSNHRLGTLEVTFAYRAGQPTTKLLAIAKTVQTDLKLATLSAKNAIDPYPYDPGYSPDTRAQALTEQMVAAHPDLIVMMIHSTPPGKLKNVVIGSNIGRLGKEADEDDLRVIEHGSTNLEVGGDEDRFETELPLLDSKGTRIGALGLVFAFHPGDDKEAIHAHGLAIRDELARSIPDSKALFAHR